MSFTPGPPSEDKLEHFEALLNAIADIERPWWRKVVDFPRFLVLAIAQLVRRRWEEWRSRQ